MRVDMVFCDMDGTYLASDKSVPADNQKIVGELAERGIAFVPCTGRMFSGIQESLVGTPQVRYAVCSMGATIVEFGPHGPKNIFEGEMPKGPVLSLYEAISSMDLEFGIFANGRSYAEDWRLAKIREFPIEPDMMQFVIKQRVPIKVSIPEFVGKLDRVERLNLYYKTDADGDRICDILGSMSELAYTRYDGCGLEVTSRSFSKGTALRWLCQKEGVSPLYVAAFGDGENDVPMLAEAGVPVAMRNGNDICKENATYMTRLSNDAAGVADFLRQNVFGA